MHGAQVLDRLDLQNNLRVHDEIKTLVAQQMTAIHHRKMLFRFERNARFA